MATIRRQLPCDIQVAQGSLKRTLYVGGLDDQVTKEILEAAFVPFGDIRTIAIPKDRTTGKHRGFGFIEFEEEEDAAQAVANMHESELYGRIVMVNLSRAPARRPGEGSRPVWGEESYLRQRNEDGTPSHELREEQDAGMAALMKCIEAQESLQESNSRHSAEEAVV